MYRYILKKIPTEQTNFKSITIIFRITQIKTKIQNK